MDFWILTIIRLRGKILPLFERLDRRIEDAALSVFGDAIKTFDIIMDLNDKKASLINLKVMFDKMTVQLSESERFIIERYAKNYSLEDIAKELLIHRSSVMRRLKKAVKKAVRVVCAMGYNEERFRAEYQNYSIVINTYNAIRREHFAHKRAAEMKSEKKNISRGVACVLPSEVFETRVTLSGRQE